MFFEGVAPCVSIMFVYTRHAFVHPLKQMEQQYAHHCGIENCNTFPWQIPLIHCADTYCAKINRAAKAII